MILFVIDIPDGGIYDGFFLEFQIEPIPEKTLELASLS